MCLLVSSDSIDRQGMCLDDCTDLSEPVPRDLHKGRDLGSITRDRM